MAVTCWRVLVTALWLTLPGVSGHGRLMDPPSRSSMWREGFSNPPNYDDNQLFCGGFSVQWERNGGKCGLCGDPWTGPRENEPGGKYANGIITRKYNMGQVIDIYVQLTAKHMGYFEFRLCQHDNPETNITQQCLDQHLLKVEGTGQTRYMVPKDGRYSQDIRLQLRLPQGLTCSACVLQWKYNTGNSWGVDPVTKRGCVGCGPQEQFYGCADVAIGHDEVIVGTHPEGSPGHTNSKYDSDHTTKGTRHYGSLSQTGHLATTSSELSETYSGHMPEADTEWRNGIAYVFGGVGDQAATSAVSYHSGVPLCWLSLLSILLVLQ